jgi:putative SOS response-associated peptidase YedK
MCGRSSLTKTEKEIEQRFNATFYSDELERYNPLPNYNGAPTHFQPVITNENPDKIHVYRWGLIPFWSKDDKSGYKMINARVDTLLDRASFKNLVSTKRCIVPMDGFYEWKTDGKEKQPYRITTTDQEIFSCAGLWDTWRMPDGQELHTYTIITLDANEMMQDIHNRMPAILEKDAESLWLGADMSPEEMLKILKQYDSSKMTAYPVSKKVGNVKERGADLIGKVPLVNQLKLF